MPTFKHPCPACGTYIARDVARCPSCGRIDPFVEGRCQTCRAPIEDAAWVACPKCGAPLREGIAPMPGTLPGAAQSPGAAPPAPASAVSPGAARPGTAPCAGCGAVLAPGARFCTVCGTLSG